MRVPLEWLREYLHSTLTPTALGDLLSMGGLELEALEPAGPELPGVVVGTVVQVQQHPHADGLRVTQVEIGGGQLQIVCGAPNVYEGQRVAVALPGAQLPTKQITTVELRGVRSEGMLCSASELGLDDGSQGLLDLDPEATPGLRLDEYLGLANPVLTLGITPNRGDALSILGVARDAAALGAGTLHSRLGQLAKQSTLQQQVDDRTVQIAASAREACGFYGLSLLEGLPRRVPDRWRERLRRCEQKSISPVVDWLNVWMLAMGQPMHAFDADLLQGDIEIRWARKGETLDALDGRDLALQEDMLVIADRVGPVALAGIIGGRRTAVGTATRRVLLESAYFSPRAIQGRARRLGLQTEAAQRFERGVDFALPQPAALLLQEEMGTRCVATWSMVGELPVLPTIGLRQSVLAKTLAMKISPETVERHLTALGCQFHVDGEGWQVIPPSHRFDLRLEADLVEEVARLYGYARLPSRQPSALLRPLQQRQHTRRRQVMATLVAREYQEIISYSFVAPELQAEIYPDLPAIKLQNALSTELSVMRTGLWPGLLQALQFNRNRQQERIRIFELGRVFADGEQRLQLAGALTGTLYREEWGSTKKPVDFFDLKGDVEALLSLWNGDWRFVRVNDPAFHPGQAAAMIRAGKEYGRLGALHPRLAEDLGLDAATFLFSLDMEDLLQEATRWQFRPISSFPSVQRDLALLIPQGVLAGDLLAALQGAESEILQQVVIFDRYEGPPLPQDRYSLGFRFHFQDQTGTLTEERVQQALERLLQRLMQVAPIELRG
ncbi:MAG: phenylalanine--tRNA ligase subunit beta [Acidithiobacillus sp.]|nr:phenylalanine--tRNA ligase subunit beta [Acidithiobacillus sp.]